MSGFHLRAAVPDDIDGLLGFWRTSAEGTDRRDDRPAVERLLARDPEALVLAVEDGAIVGSLITGWDGWRCHLYRLAVREDRRGHGVARALLAAAEQRGALEGAHRIDAMVLEANALAHPAWSALGYAPQPEWRRWVKPLDPPPR